MQDLPIDATLSIPAAQLRWTAVRARGPGGQHVNKTSTSVELRFDPGACEALDPGTRLRLQKLAATMIDGSGEIRIRSEGTRSQFRNLEEARSRLRALIVAAMVVPRRRRPTKIPRGVQRRRLENKRRQSAKKRDRARPRED